MVGHPRMDSGSGPVVLAAGGTGGHVFPAQALAEELLRRGVRLALVTDRRGGEYGDALAGIDTYKICAATLGGGPFARVAAIARIGRGIIEARRVLRRLDARLVVGFGGYPSVPTLLAASWCGVPVLIHEQNAVLGRANRLLARRAAAIATSFAEVAGIEAKDRAKSTRTGNPVREAIAQMASRPYPTIEAAELLNCLVIGGSQGAQILSRVVPQAVALLSGPKRARLGIAQQCRPEDLAHVHEAYDEIRFDAELAPFFDDVPERLGRAHLVIARSGASTVAELTAVGRPAILVPYARAADDHQTANGRALDEAGAAWLMSEAAFTPEALASRLEAFLDLPATLVTAAKRALAVGEPNAASRLADLVSRLLNGGESQDHHTGQEAAA